MAATAGTPRPLRSPLFAMADRMAGGQLLAEMRRLYEQTRSWEQVGRDLYAEHQIVVTGQTLRMWARHFGIGEAA